MAKKLRYGLIDKEGAWRLEPRFEKIGWYGDGRVPFGEGKKWGFADLNGDVLVPAVLDFVYPFAGGVACVEEAGAWRAIDRDGGVAAGWRAEPAEGRIRTCVDAWPSRDRFEPAHPQARFGFLDADGAVLVEPRFTRAGDFRNGRAMVQLPPEAGAARFAYLGLDGAIAIEPFEAWDARAFSDEGLARVKGMAGWRFIDRSGATVVEASYQDVAPFSEGLSMVSGPDKRSAWSSDLKGYIDRRGELVIDRQFEDGGPFSSGLARVRVHEGPGSTEGFIDTSGARVIAATFRKVYDFCDEVAPACIPDPAAWSSNLWGLVDKTGAWRVEPTFAAIAPFQMGAARFRRHDDTQGMFDGRGQIVADGYASIEHFGYPSAVNRGGKPGPSSVKGGKWGFVDATGKEIVACRFEKFATTFRDGLAGVGDKVKVD